MPHDDLDKRALRFAGHAGYGRHGGSEWHRLSDVAQRQQLSKKSFKFITAFDRANLVESAVGRSGGYRLTRFPEDYP